MAIPSIVERVRERLAQRINIPTRLPPCDLSDLAAEEAALRRDAERYRYLREPQEHASVTIEDQNEDGWNNTFCSLVRKELDAALDEIIAEGR